MSEATSQQFIDVAGTGIKSGFGRVDKPGARTKHKYGMDLSYDSWGKVGEPIKNIAGDGKVLEVRKSNKGAGNTVLVDYGGRQVRYNHLQGFNVKPGQTLKAGQVLGTMGASGYSPSGAHISYEFRQNGKVVPANVAFADAKFSDKWGGKTGSWGSARQFDLSTKRSVGSATSASTATPSFGTTFKSSSQTSNVVSRIF
jgi:murein DD-endopeptidase MepM/ murein hydrolase activator NlpD